LSVEQNYGHYGINVIIEVIDMEIGKLIILKNEKM